MRFDSTGLWWEDVEVVKVRGGIQASRTPPPIPDTGWVTPTEFPRLDNAKLLAIDLETYDPELLDKGMGWGRGVGHIVGVAVGTDDGGRWYFPMRHTLGGNMDPEKVLSWCRDTFANPKQPKVFANALYDLGWLKQEGVDVKGDIIDIQIAEPLLDEYARSYSLESLSNKYLNESKLDDQLYDWCQRSYGGPEGRRQAGNIYRAPVELVGPYACGDVDLPLRIWEKQRPLLEAQKLTNVFKLESALIPMLLAMRMQGVRVDVNKAQQVYDDFTTRLNGLTKQLGGMNINAGEELARYAKKMGITPPTTDKGNPSFGGPWLAANMPLVAEARKYMKARDTFVKGYILDLHTDGRLHCQFNQLRSDEYGTVSGRFSSSNPNLQNIPARDEEIGPLIRSLFLPEEGETWVSHDWSQIEFRALTHYAVGDGADLARAMYNENPSTDFHVMASELTGVPRKPAKNLNFGLVYGMGETALASHLGKSKEEAQPIFDQYHTNMPFIKETYNLAGQRASQRGFITTLLGRRARFNLWESSKWSDKGDALPEGDARDKWGNKVRRAHTHKALNRLLQGSAADIMKKAMADIWAANIGLAPLLTVHDELDWSCPNTAAGHEAMREANHIMTTCVKMKIPLLVDEEMGESWGTIR